MGEENMGRDNGSSSACKAILLIVHMHTVVLQNMKYVVHCQIWYEYQGGMRDLGGEGECVEVLFLFFFVDFCLFVIDFNEIHYCVYFTSYIMVIYVNRHLHTYTQYDDV